ncbi:MAG: RagB/SusD family nutrient uptake outer membrane protein [Chitinophagaceae bacterium]
MKKFVGLKNICLVVVLLSGMVSCKKDILDFSDPNSYNYANYFNTPDEISKGANAIYVTFYHNNMMGFEWPEMFDVLANEAAPTLPALANEPAVSALWQYQYVNTNATIERFWKMLYKMVLRSNLVIDKSKEYITKHGDDNAKIVSRSSGEAHFLRGYAYSQLAFYWGRVPIRTSFDQSDNVNAARSKTADEVWAVAESDFKMAQTLLPESWNAENVGRSTKGAATGFLGKLYLYNKKYIEAEAQFATLNGKYNLLPGQQWADNFGETNKNNQESLFEVQFQWFDGNNTFGPLGNPEGSNNVPSTHTARQQLYGWNDWGNWFFPPRRVSDFVYDNESAVAYIDPRAKLTFYGGIGAMTWLNHAPGGSQPYDFATYNYWYKKNQNKEYKKSEDNLKSSNNLRLLRYADILLMRAECKMNAGDVPGALGFINQIRSRIGAFTYLKSYTQAQAMELLKRERQLELMGEQCRFNDLKRWGILKETINMETQAIFGSPRVLDKHYLFPIPLGEIDSNVGLGAVADQWN